MSPIRTSLVILGAIIALVAAALLAAGAATLGVATLGRDADGFLTSPAYELSTGSAAVVTDRIDLGARPGDWLPEPGDLTFRVTATPEGERAVFVGIAAEADVAAYLDGVAHDRITQLGDPPDDVVSTPQAGDEQVDGPPAAQSFWAASAEGTGTQTITWDAQPGTWQLVLMNADGTTGVVASATAGVEVPILVPIGIGLLVAALLLAGLAAGLLVTGAATGGRTTAMSTPAAHAQPRVHPVAITGRLDPDLTRWQWLVKWVLAIPHMIVLALLWVGFVVLTFVAWVAILFTGRYPRAIFDFNVGVLRWTWRVTYYAFGVLGTDAYPPFSLRPDPTYPAELDIVYPERLSRGLALVKWILAIPHLIIVGLLTGSAFTFDLSVGGQDGPSVGDGGGVLAVLAVIAGVILLVRGSYPRGLFDVIMGLQRWTYRVGAYVALMTDEYPPFRLDSGGAEPGTPLPVPPPPASPASDAQAVSADHERPTPTRA